MARIDARPPVKRELVGACAYGWLPGSSLSRSRFARALWLGVRRAPTAAFPRRWASCCRRQAAGDRAGNQLRPDHLRRRRRELAVDLRAARDVVGYLYTVGRAAARRFYALSPDEGLRFQTTNRARWQRRRRRARRPVVSATSSSIAPTPIASWRRASIPSTADVRGRAVAVRIDRRRRHLRLDAALHGARRRDDRQHRDRAQQSAWSSTWRCTRPPIGHPPVLRSFDRGRTWVDRDVEAGARRERFPHPDRRPGRRDVLYLRVIGASGRRALAVTRDGGHDLRDAGDHRRRGAQRVRAARERHGPGRRPGQPRAAAVA